MDATKPIVLVLAGRLGPPDVPRLCDELTARLRDVRDPGDADVICDVRGLTQPNLAAVNALARLRLLARRRGLRLRLRGAGRDLRLLLDLVGLTDLAPCPVGTGGEDP